MPNDLAFTDNGCVPDGNMQTCTWTISGIANVSAGVNTITVTVDDQEGGQTVVDVTITVLPEYATVSFFQ